MTDDPLLRHRAAINPSRLTDGASSLLLCQLDGRHSGDVTVGDSRMPAATVWALLERGIPHWVIHEMYPWVSLEDVVVLDRLRCDVARREEEDDG